MSIKTTTAKPVSATPTLVFSFDEGVVNTLVSMNIHNLGTTDCIFKVWITKITSGTPGDADRLDTGSLAAGETFVRTCGHLDPTESIYVETSNGEAAVRITALLE